MPTYCFKVGNAVVEETMSIRELETRRLPGGRYRLRGGRKGRMVFSPPGGFRPNCWPMKSWAMSVNPNYIKEAMAKDQRLGVKAEYDKRTGDAIFTSPRHRKEYCEAHGFFDRNGGYSDPRRRKGA